MTAIDLCNILERKYKKGEFQCNMDSCGNKPCDLCTVEKFEKKIRADERTKTIDTLMDEVAQIKGISDEDWNLLEQKAEQMKGDKK